MIQPAKKMICRDCLRDTGYTENSFTHYVIPPEGVKCPHCESVLIKSQQYFLASRPNGTKPRLVKA